MSELGSRRFRNNVLRFAGTFAVVAGLSAAQAGPASAITPEVLTDAAQTKVFFGHQSVGYNVLDGVRGLYASGGVSTPPIVTAVPAGTEGGFVAHQTVGTNGDPASKIAAFDNAVRGGIGDKVDVALMKLCYVDISANTDVNAVFAKYRNTLSGLQRDFPDVTFLHTTVPLTTDTPADNANREKLNAMIRSTYGGQLFDLAAAESTTPAGIRVSGLYPGYASDNGHLNSAGASAAGSVFLEAIARAA
jgi:hypothetical protein